MPSIPAKTAEPGAAACAVAEGRARRDWRLRASLSPAISNTPISSVGAEAVLDRAQNAEVVAAIALEIEHRVDHVLDQLGPGDLAVLGDMPDQDDGAAARLGEAHQRLGRPRAPG